MKAVYDCTCGYFCGNTGGNAASGCLDDCGSGRGDAADFEDIFTGVLLSFACICSAFFDLGLCFCAESEKSGGEGVGIHGIF